MSAPGSAPPTSLTPARNRPPALRLRPGRPLPTHSPSPLPVRGRSDPAWRGRAGVGARRSPNPRPALPPPPQAGRPWPVRRPWAASPSGAGAWASCRSSRPSSRGTVSVARCWGAVCRLEDLPGLGESGRAQGGFKGSPAPCPASGLRGGWGRRCAGPGCWLARAGHPHLGPFPPQSPAHTRSSR